MIPCSDAVWDHPWKLKDDAGDSFWEADEWILHHSRSMSSLSTQTQILLLSNAMSERLRYNHERCFRLLARMTNISAVCARSRSLDYKRQGELPVLYAT